jgi:hypothetical protein
MTVDVVDSTTKIIKRVKLADVQMYDIANVSLSSVVTLGGREIGTIQNTVKP